MHNFKPGDLALIVGGCPARPANLGAVVVLDQLIGTGARFKAVGHIRVCLTDSPCWVCLSDNVTSAGGVPGFVLLEPKHLIPLRGDEQTAPAKREELTW